jgi:hypothetical protein
MNNTTEILNIFTSKEDGREWMQSPFIAGNKLIATNAWALVAIPRSPEYLFEDRTEKVKTVYPVPHNCNREIKLSALKEAISNAPLIDCFDETSKRCPACRGEGEVDFEFNYKGKDFTTEAECPVCSGEGSITSKSHVPNGKKEPDYSKCIRIGASIFNIERLEELVLAAQLIGSETITLVKQAAATESSVFTIEEVEVLVMPVLENGEENVCATVEIN